MTPLLRSTHHRSLGHGPADPVWFGYPNPRGRRGSDRQRAGPVNPSVAVHADPVARAIVGAADASPRAQLGCFLGVEPVALPPVTTGLPMIRCVRAKWLFAPSGTASTSWAMFRFPTIPARGPITRDPIHHPGLRALSGTSTTFANGKAQVKRYFQIPRVIPQTSCSSPGKWVSSTVHAQVHAHGCPQVVAVSIATARPACRHRLGSDWRSGGTPG